MTIGKRIVQVMHQTVREFFLDEDGCMAHSGLFIQEKNAHLTLTVICIRYLTTFFHNMPFLNVLEVVVERALSEDLKRYVEYLDQWPFAAYALAHLRYHMNQSDTDGSFSSLLAMLVDQTTDMMGAWPLLGLPMTIFEEICDGLQNGLKSKHYNIQPKSIDIQSFFKRYPFFIRHLICTAAAIGCPTAVEIIMESRGQHMKDEQSTFASSLPESMVPWEHPKINETNKFGRTPLSYAAENGHSVVVKFLINEGADIDISDTDPRTVLWGNAEDEYEPVTRTLPDYGADYGLPGKTKRTPLTYAAANGHLEVVRLLISTQGLIISTQTRVNRKDLAHRTPLSWAAEHGHELVVKTLLEYGADRHIRDKSGREPLEYAMEHGHENIVQLLRNPPSLAVADEGFD